MELNLSGAPEIAASRDHVWRRLLDPEAVAQSTPGVESLSKETDQRYTVQSSVGIGGVRVSIPFLVELHSLVEPRSAGMRLSGTAHQTNITIDSKIQLSDITSNRVQLHWQATTTVEGLLAGLVGPLLESATRAITEQFWIDFALRAGETYT